MAAHRAQDPEGRDHPIVPPDQAHQHTSFSKTGTQRFYAAYAGHAPWGKRYLSQLSLIDGTRLSTSIAKSRTLLTVLTVRSKKTIEEAKQGDRNIRNATGPLHIPSTWDGGEPKLLGEDSERANQPPIRITHVLLEENRQDRDQWKSPKRLPRVHHNEQQSELCPKARLDLKPVKKGQRLKDEKKGVMMKRRAPCIGTLLLIMVATCQALSSDTSREADPRISGLVIGHAGFVWHDPFRSLFIRDPLFTYALYPLPPDLDDNHKRKLDRVYYPRTKKALIDTYDLLVFHDARIQHFSSRQFSELDYAFREAQVTGIWVFMGSFLWDWVLEPSILREVVPISRHEKAHFAAFRVRFRRDRDPVFLPFLEYGIGKVVGNAVAEMTARQGATVWGEIIPQKQPWMVSWRPGGGNPGMQWVLNEWYLKGWWNEDNNPFALDVATNMILYSLDRPLISDIPARREARHLFTGVETQKSLALSMMEWADAFGADTQTLSKRLNDLGDGIGKATDRYVEQDYPATISILQSISRTVSDIADEAIRLKDRALLWVFIIEWLGVTGVSVLSGSVVWTLMIRRRYYRRAQVTRLRRGTEGE